MCNFFLCDRQTHDRFVVNLFKLASVSLLVEIEKSPKANKHCFTVCCMPILMAFFSWNLSCKDQAVCTHLSKEIVQSTPAHFKGICFTCGHSCKLSLFSLFCHETLSGK